MRCRLRIEFDVTDVAAARIAYEEMTEWIAMYATEARVECHVLPDPEWTLVAAHFPDDTELTVDAIPVEEVPTIERRVCASCLRPIEMDHERWLAVAVDGRARWYHVLHVPPHIRIDADYNERDEPADEPYSDLATQMASTPYPFTDDLDADDDDEGASVDG